MITAPSATKRLLIPRWRTFADTAASGELSSKKVTGAVAITSGRADEFHRRRESWHRFPSELTAAELVEAAIVLGHEEAASSAAQFLTSVQADVTPLVRRQSQQLLMRINPAEGESARTEISLRDRLRMSPEDAVLWVELALRQVISGANDSAVRSMKTALAIAPNNRFVLRSAARLFSHIHEPDIGYEFLRRSSATEYDPWLMSAEISMAGRAERRPAFLRKGLVLLDRESSPSLDFSELAGAAATTFLEGSIPKRQAKKLFGQSLGAPTDNAVAQAEWASQATGERFLDAERVPSFRYAKEARALHAFNIGNYNESLQAAEQWIAEEPFSGRAYASAAAAANTMDDYAAAIRICMAGIRHDPKSPSLKNSLVFALACSDRLDEAEGILAEAHLYGSDSVSELVSTANRGLIALRRGAFDVGEALYEKAIAGFKKDGHSSLAVSALVYFAREAKRAGHPKSKSLISDVKMAIRNKRHLVAEKIVKELEAVPLVK